MLAPGLAASARITRALARLLLPPLHLYRCEKRNVSALHSLSTRHQPTTDTAPSTGASQAKSAAQRETCLLRDLRASIGRQDTDTAVRVYGELRESWASGNIHTELRMDDLRSLHILLRRSVTRPKSPSPPSSEECRRALLVIIVQAIDDMRRLGLRVGATEIAAALYAHSQLGHYSATVDCWRVAVSQIYAADAESPHSLDFHIRHLFPQTHTYALTAAVALKSLRSVRDVYRDAMHLMDLSPNGPPAAFFWALFPAYSERSSTAATSSGSDRAWDCSRLGSVFLEQVLSDAIKWTAGNDAKLLSRIVQALVRALLAEGRIHRATRLYDRVLAEPQNTAPRMTSWILCEMVAGLCRHSLLDDAYNALCNAARTHRTVHAWNAYLDGVANSMRPAQYSASGKRQQRDEARAPLAVLKRMQTCIDWMEKSDNVKPDLATRSIWLRACFRAAEWTRAYTYFHTHYEYMRSDIVCWDIAIRGLFESGNVDAQREGWRLVSRLVSQIDASTGPTTDARLVETILLYLFPRYRPSYQPPPARTLDQRTLADILAWIETRMPQRRKITYAIVIGSLLATDQIARALEVYRAMIRRKLWPSKSINCMLAKSLASSSSSSSSDPAEEWRGIA
ncbi:hypothetical protein GGI00_003998, partial [Coemansia sp. RSA 2681]